jgi:hypothetical protein
MNTNFYDISIEDMIRYHNCRKKIRSGMYKNGRICIGCKFNLPIEKFKYLNNAEKRKETRLFL